MKILGENPLVNVFLRGVTSTWDLGDATTPLPRRATGRGHHRATKITCHQDPRPYHGRPGQAHLLPRGPHPCRAGARPLPPALRSRAAGPGDRHVTWRGPLPRRACRPAREQGYGRRGFPYSTTKQDTILGTLLLAVH